MVREPSEEFVCVLKYDRRPPQPNAILQKRIIPARRSKCYVRELPFATEPTKIMCYVVESDNQVAVLVLVVYMICTVQTPPRDGKTTVFMSIVHVE